MIEFVKRWIDGERDRATMLVLRSALRLFAPAHSAPSHRGCSAAAGSVLWLWVGDVVSTLLEPVRHSTEMAAESQVLASIRSTRSTS